MKASKKKSLLASRKRLWVGLALALVCFWPLCGSPAMAEVHSSYLYKLSSFDGPVTFKTAHIDVDDIRKEIYVADSRQGEVRIFNTKGMEVYRFGDDGQLGSIIDIAVDSNGNILVLGRKANRAVIVQCDFKGRARKTLQLQGVPREFETMLPNRMAYRDGQLYLLDTNALRLVVTDVAGHFRKGYDLASVIGLEAKKRRDVSVGGFSIDPHGNILFTIPVMFTVFRLSPEGNLLSFGTPGSAPGRFGVVGGIVADGQGYYYVADRLKSVILIFDPQLKFQTEFGYRGFKPHNLISPSELDLDDQGRLYVTQLGNRGVSVFKITHP